MRRGYQTDQILQLLRVSHVSGELNVVPGAIPDSAAGKSNHRRLFFVPNAEYLRLFINSRNVSAQPQDATTRLPPGSLKDAISETWAVPTSTSSAAAETRQPKKSCLVLMQ